MNKEILKITFNQDVFTLNFQMDEPSFESKLELFKNGIMIADTYREDPSVTLYPFYSIEGIRQEVMEKLLTKVKEKNDVKEYLNDISADVDNIRNALDDIETNTSYIEDEL